jgi:ATP-dependent Clp protease ATP-binding subunit ClpC
MFSDLIKSKLESEVIGQPWAINSVVRGVTRVVSGLTPRERTLCAYMFVGPTGTGKTHLVEALAGILHGDERRVVVADCSQFTHGDPWMAFAAQLAPLFAMARMSDQWAVLEPPPLSIIRIEHLERGPKEITKSLAAALETGQIMLPEGRRGSLRNCLLFMTSGLCTREILDEAPQIGFSGTQEGEAGEGQEKLYEICHERADEQFGSDLMGRLDEMIIFHKLQQEHLSEILDRRASRLGGWLAQRGLRYELQPEAKAFLLERGRRDLRRGARDLVSAHRKFVEFPMADLLVSGRISDGRVVIVDRKAEESHLHFTVTKAESERTVKPFHEVPVSWEEERTACCATPAADRSA